jgi:hypothetical protein
MKNTKILLAILAIALVFGMTVCSNGGGGGGTPQQQGLTSTVYESKNGNDIYILEITSSAAGNNRAVYNPKDGDDYTLTIIQASGTKESKGKVKTNSSGSFALTPNGSTASFTVSISNDRMNKIDGTIKTTDGKSLSAPGAVTPIVVTTPEKFDLLAEYWGSVGGDSSEEWTNAIDLTKFTSFIPKKGDVLRFKVSGTTDKPLKWLSASVGNYTDDGQDEGEYRWLGGSEDHVSVSGTFEKTFNIHIYNDPDPNLEMFEVGLGNTLWRKDSSGNYTINTGLTLPPGYVKLQTVMATISNFSIRLVGMYINLE